MKSLNLRGVLLGAMLLAAAGLFAQNPATGGHGPGGHGPGGPAAAASTGTPGAKGDSAAPARGSEKGKRVGIHNGLQFGPTGRWWDNKLTVHAVGISTVQQRRMDAVFDANKPAILATYKTLLAEQAKLSDLNKSPQPNQAAVFAQIDTVNQARGALQKATTQMLLQIRQEMAPDQIEKLEEIQ